MTNETLVAGEDETVEDPSRRFMLGRLATLAVGTALVTTLPVSAALADDDDFGGRFGRRLRSEFRRMTRGSRGRDDGGRGRRDFAGRRDDNDDDDGGGRGWRGRGRDDNDDDDGDGRGGRGGRGGGRGGRGGNDDDD